MENHVDVFGGHWDGDGDDRSWYGPMERSEERIPVVLDAIALLWERNPDLVFGQLLARIADNMDESLDHAEDIKLFRCCTEIVNQTQECALEF